MSLDIPAHGGEIDIDCRITVTEPWPPAVASGDGARREPAAEPPDEPAAEPPDEPAAEPAAEPPDEPPANAGGLDRIASGALRYIAACTALRVGPSRVCLVTDHRLLPLSWTRDAYYQAVLLLCHTEDPRYPALVHDHLRWLWGEGRPADGVWMRSHLTGGAVKDPGVQPDQQLYPFLELCDYRRIAGRWPDPPSGRWWPDLVAETWSRLAPDPVCGLLPGSENPADDPAGLPFALSSQILYWYVTARLAQWSADLGLDGRRLRTTARSIRAAVHAHFTAPGPFGAQWAYESDGDTGRRLYQDANDLPTALGPLWGFCPASDPRWRATMRFAFDRHNPGYQAGPWGGLGSAHTPGTWPLGDVQQWIAGEYGVDPDRGAAARRRLAAVASHDGMLPEAYSAADGRWLARDWFAWPGAAVGAVRAALTGRPTPWAGGEPVPTR